MPAYGLQIRPLGPELISRSTALRSNYSKLSIYDAFALTLASHECSPLLTGDGHLRSAAASEGVQVFGTLWLMEKMLMQKLLTLPEMEAAYQAMIDSQRRLPAPEINKQLRCLKSALA